MKILIVDDENLARERLWRLVENETSHEVIGEATNGKEALEKIDALHPDLVLLDIRMPGIDGLEVARHMVDMEEPPAVIFTTAYDEYALEAFKVNAADYLLKPVSAERLIAGLSKVIKPNKAQWRALNQEDGKPKARTHISARTRKGITLVPLENVFYFKAEHKYVTVCHQEGEVVIDVTLKELEEEFDPKYLRIHRNCLVSTDSIQGLEKNLDGQPCLRLRGIEEPLEISRRHLPKIREVMSQK